MKRKRKKSAASEEGSLPESLDDMGEPLSIHPPHSAVRALDGVAEKLKANNPINKRWFVLLCGGLFVVVGLILLGIYFFNPPQGESPLFVLIPALIFLGGGCAVAVGSFFMQAGSPAATKRDRTTYVVYPDALALVRGDDSLVVRWDEVDELLGPMMGLGGCYTLVLPDGTKLMINQWIKDYDDLIETLVDRVTAALVPRAMKKIQAGEWVKFGPFQVGAKGLKYKGRAARWKEISSMEIRTGRSGRRLTIYQEGRVLAWCWHDLNCVPSDAAFYKVLCQTAPDHLLAH